MMKKSIKKLIAMGMIVGSIFCTSPVTAHAEWIQNSDNTWSNTNVESSYTGWRLDNSNFYYFKSGIMATGWVQDPSNSKWYYFDNDGKLLRNTVTPDGFKVDAWGVWNQNITTNNTTNVTNTDTSNSNNLTNTTNNVDNSTQNSNNRTLNNTGSINYGYINNGTINNNTVNNSVKIANDKINKAQENYYKELTRIQQKNEEATKVLYEKQLSESKQDLAEAQIDLERANTQLTIKTLEKDSNGQWQYKGVADQSRIDSAQKRVNSYKNSVDTYEKLAK